MAEFQFSDDAVLEDPAPNLEAELYSLENPTFDTAPEVEFGALEYVGQLAYHSSLEFADLTASSLTLGAIEKDTIANAVLNVMPERIQAFRKQEYGAIEVVAGIESLITSTLAATRIVGAVGKTGQLLSRVPGVKHLLTDAPAMKMALDKVRTAQLVAAQAGKTGIAAVDDVAVVAAKKIANRVGLKNSLKTGVASEAMITLAGNQSNFIFPEEFETETFAALAALGIAVPTALESIYLGYMYRQSANLAAPEAHRVLNPMKLDLSGTTSLSSKDELRAGIEASLRDDVRDVTATNYALAAHALKQPNFAANPDRSVRVTAAKQSNAHLTSATTALENIWNRGAAGWQGSAGKFTDEIKFHLNHTLKNDPTSAIGIQKFTPAPTTGNELLEITSARAGQMSHLDAQANTLEAALKIAVQSNKKKVKFGKESLSLDVAQERLGVLRLQSTNMKSWQFSVLRDGEYVPESELAGNFGRYSESDPLAGLETIKLDEDRVIHGVGIGNRGKAFDINSSDPFSLGVYNDLTTSLPKVGKKPNFAKDFSSLTSYQAGALYASGRKAIRSALQSRGAVINVTNKSNFFEIDMALEVKKLEGASTAEINSRVHFHDALNIDTALMKSLGQKSVLWNRMAGQAKKSGNPINATGMRERLNLPKKTTYEQALGQDHASLELFFIENAKLGNAELKGVTPETVRNVISTDRRALEFLEESAESIKLQGTSFYMGTTGIDVGAKPLVQMGVWRRNPFQQDFTGETLKLQQAAQRMNVMEQLTDPGQSTLISRMVRQAIASEDFTKSLQVSTLSDAGRTSSLPGLKNTLNKGATTFFNNTWRDMPTMLAANRVRTNFEKVSRAFTDELWKLEVRPGVSISDSFATLRASENAPSQQFFNNWVSIRRQGWVLKSQQREVGTTDAGTKLYEFALDTSDSASGHFNAEKWQVLYGTPMPKNAAMPLKVVDGETQSVLVDEKALDALIGMVKAQDNLFKEQNLLRSQRGHSPIAYKDWHLPATRFEDKHITYITAPVKGANQETVYTLRANSAGELKRMEEHPKVQEFIDRIGGELLEHATVKDYYRDLDLDFIDIADPNILGIQTGKVTKGGAASPFLAQGGQVLDEIKDSITFNINTIARNTMSVLYEPQLRYVKSLANSVESGGKASAKARDTFYNSVYSEYRQVILGERMGDPNSRISRVFTSLEENFDASMASVYDAMGGQGIRAGALAKIRGTRKADEKAFQSLDKMGEHNPFNNAVEMVAERFNTRLPSTLKGLTNEINRVTAGITLRWGEIGHPLLNISGVVNTMPSIMSHMRMLPGESASQMAQRLGDDAILIPSNTGPIAVFDNTKLMMRTIGDLFSEQGMKDIARVQKKGYADQAVAEIHKTLGDPSKTQDFAHNIGRQADNILGKLSDKSEEWSRIWSHMAGLRIARKFGKILDDDAADVFAHNFANKVIGDYRTLNRPQMFQGAVGQSLALFQTYMFNYFSRMFRYLETKDMRAFATQMGMQGALYGGVSVPGYNLVTQLFAEAQGANDTIDPVNGLYKRFGRNAGDLMMHGGLSNLPKLAGSYDGIALFTRGDVNPRVPTSIGTLPGPSVMGNMLVGVGKGIDMFREGSPGVTARQTAEIAANYIGSRPLRGFIESAIGQASDRNGNLVSENIGNITDLTAYDTERGIKFIARALSLKTQMESAQNQAYYRNRTAMSIQRDIRDRLNRGTRTAMRLKDPELIAQAVIEAVDAGAKPDYIPTWLKNTHASATTPRTELMLEEALKNPASKLSQALRLWQLGVDMPDK